jgi:hypothetical protein
MASKAELKIGMFAKVVDPAGGLSPNRLRRLPKLDPNNIIASISVGRHVKIIGGPCEQADGWVWWIVRVQEADLKLCDVPIDSNVGWMNEWSGDQLHDEYNLVKV